MSAHDLPLSLTTISANFEYLGLPFVCTSYQVLEIQQLLSCHLLRAGNAAIHSRGRVFQYENIPRFCIILTEHLGLESLVYTSIINERKTTALRHDDSRVIQWSHYIRSSTSTELHSLAGSSFDLRSILSHAGVQKIAVISRPLVSR